MSFSFLLGAAALAAAVVAFASARFLAAKGWLSDQPGERSSHKAPTSRAGGIAVIAGFLIPAAGLALIEPGLWKFVALLVGAFALGLADDARPLPAAAKLLGQVAVATGFVLTFGAVEAVPAPFIGVMPLGPAAPAFTVFWIVAFMNAFNFMDGANGLAATAAIFGLSALAVATAATGEVFAAAAVLMAGALFGFLPHNFPKARLFLGDSGSQSVGFSIAALAALAATPDAGATSALFAPTVFMPFLFDVAFTLAHRVIRRRNIAAAHNEHLYQLLMRLGSRHAAVTTLYLSLVAVSTLAAILASALPASLQFLAPACLFALFLGPAAIVFRKASAAGLLAAAARAAPESAAGAAG